MLSPMVHFSCYSYLFAYKIKLSSICFNQSWMNWNQTKTRETTRKFSANWFSFTIAPKSKYYSPSTSMLPIKSKSLFSCSLFNSSTEFYSSIILVLLFCSVFYLAGSVFQLDLVCTAKNIILKSSLISNQNYIVFSYLLLSKYGILIWA